MEHFVPVFLLYTQLLFFEDIKGCYFLSTQPKSKCPLLKNIQKYLKKFFFKNTGSFYIAQPCLELIILLPPSPKC
jgi:hypothetical protein